MIMFSGIFLHFCHVKKFPIAPLCWRDAGPGFFAAGRFLLSEPWFSFSSFGIHEYRWLSVPWSFGSPGELSTGGFARTESQRIIERDRVCLRDRSEILYGKTCWGSINLGDVFLIR